MSKLIDPKTLDAELEAAAKRKSERDPALAGAAGGKPATCRDLAEVAGAAAAASAIALRHVATNTEAALARLEERLDDLQRKAMVFRGAFDVAKPYDSSDVVMRSSGLYVALRATQAGDAPGASSSWRRIAESRA